ncbi:maleylpyruvate isomerase family mycothiol-dependent enzyme [Frigidibacter albus]|uniref:Maleylpyruvate isomerase family mycothiol-dependent enzyme n=1 Tax=Frigidibacter albus TaxID=1465486 RepID=A0A6L8VMR1_9RHOB|nr:maleylpyruvate isomerase family mycothiol-dependent enzyme [Frigidibacter albus]MZQ91076.1 maleylpyruvate isomerase family mycothiol-dependent enzyme [Frigidibacter albus]NBE32961.1 maleylpyruvate isomerase family mycothiol-dependent enzyme [Frigidibacter albus]GGH62674.1 TIGR03084 family protein [Frigidibacter albus]
MTQEADDLLAEAALHSGNAAALLALTDETAAKAYFAAYWNHLDQGGDKRILEVGRSGGLSGPDLLDLWQAGTSKLATALRGTDPARRVPWAGQTMSARSLASARLMETWAHGQEVFDEFGVARHETDGIRAIMVLGVNTYDWSFRVNGLPVPTPRPALRLVAPSGAHWDFGEAGGETITGSAVEFCQVVAQTRNILDTGLQVNGVNATRWMALAQCFAGPPRTPPPAGTRFRKAPAGN